MALKLLLVLLLFAGVAFTQSKSQIIRETVNAGTQTIKTFPIIPSGDTWKLDMFGAMDINFGDNKSSVYILQFGSTGSWTTVRVISVTGTTTDMDIFKEFTGNGTKRFRVIMINNSGTNKDLAFWMIAKKRN